MCSGNVNAAMHRGGEGGGVGREEGGGEEGGRGNGSGTVPESPPPPDSILAEPMLSISSMKMIEGACSLHNN